MHYIFECHVGIKNNLITWRKVDQITLKSKHLKLFQKTKINE